MEGTNSNLNEVRQLVADDYLDLWKYFEDRADDLKERMFESVTWIIGFAAAVLGFIFGKFVDLSGTTLVVKEKWLAVCFCGVGILLCVYAGFVLAEHAHHIQRNWNRANQFKGSINGLSARIDITAKTDRRQTQVWFQVGIIVGLFALAFVFTAVFLLSW